MRAKSIYTWNLQQKDITIRTYVLYCIIKVLALVSVIARLMLA